MKSSVCHRCPDRWIKEDGTMCRSTCDDYHEEQEANEARRQKAMRDNRIRAEIYDIHDTAVRRADHE